MDIGASLLLPNFENLNLRYEKSKCKATPQIYSNELSVTDGNCPSTYDFKIEKRTQEAKKLVENNNEALLAENMKDELITYGHLILIGYNGSLPDGDKGRKRSRFQLTKRLSHQKGHGVTFHSRTLIPDTNQLMKIPPIAAKPNTYSVTYTFMGAAIKPEEEPNKKTAKSATLNNQMNTDGNSKFIIYDEYKLDPATDMFQIGRSPEKPIDFVVLDTPCTRYTYTTNALKIQPLPPLITPNFVEGQTPQAYKCAAENGGPLPTNKNGQLKKPSSGPRINGNEPSTSSKNCVSTNNININCGKNANGPPQLTESTISRFACRLTVSRSAPYKARIFAAGFDSSNNIFLGPKAVKWRKGEENLVDGLTTNGVLISHENSNPTDHLTKTNINTTRQWYEVSVEGRLYTLRSPQAMNTCGRLVEHVTNELKDWTLIDICGATLLWRTDAPCKESQTNSKHLANYDDSNIPTHSDIEAMIDKLNAGKPQCPVRLSTLIVSKKNTLNFNTLNCNKLLKNGKPEQTRNNKIVTNLDDTISSDYSLNGNSGYTDEVCNAPYVYLMCGHVQGLHEWGLQDDNTRKCPICQMIGPITQLKPGLEPAFWRGFRKQQSHMGASSFTHAFIPCGHMANEETVSYWSAIAIPSADFRHLCPFCATELGLPPNKLNKNPEIELIVPSTTQQSTKLYVKLHFQGR